MSTAQYTVHGKDVQHARRVKFTDCGDLAQPTAPIDSAAWKRVNSEIAMAQAVLNPTGVSIAMACVPDNWVAPDNTSYWSTFDSTQSQGGARVTTTPAAATPTLADATAAPVSSGANPQTLRTISPTLWSIKPAAAQAAQPATLNYIHAISPAAPMAAGPIARTAFARPVALEATVDEPPDRSELLVRSIARAPGVSPIPRQIPIDRPPGQGGRPAAAASASASAAKLQHDRSFQYMSVTIGYMAAGIPVWNGVFLADTSWCAGMAKGGMLPAPDIALQRGTARSPTVCQSH
jgi:hypothetical protein